MAKELYKLKLQEHLGDLDSFVKRPDSRHNVGSYLGEIFTWQEVKDYSESALKEAWRKAREDGVVPSDEDLRALGTGEHIVVESNSFSCLATINKPRKNLDVEALVDALVKKFKLDRGVVVGMVEKCKKDGTPPLSKRVREV